MYSSQTLVSDGTVNRVDLSIEYIDKSDIQVFVDDALLPTNGYAWTWASDTAINFNQPVRLGSVINIRRTTAYDNIKHVFEVGGAVFKDRNVDENFRQVLYWCQDFIEGKSIEDVWNNLNMHGFRITSIGTAIDSYDVVSLGQYQADAMGAWVAKRETELLKEAAFDKLTTTQGYSDAMKLVLESADTALNVPFPDGSSIPTVAKRTVGLTSAVTSVNGKIGNVVLGEAVDFKGNTVVRTVADKAQLPDPAISSLCIVKAPNDLGVGTTYRSDGTGWVELKRLLNPYDFGATYTGDNTAAITLANTYANTAQVQIELPTNAVFEVDNCNINTANFVGAGKLLFKNHNHTMLPKYRKGSGNSDIITLEDEYGSHIDASNRYSGFGCSVMMNGAEWVVSRTAKNPYYDAAIPSSLVMYKIDRNQDNKVTKSTLITESAGRDIRDANASIYPAQPSHCLIKYALQTSANTFEGRLMTYDASTGVVSNRKLLVPTNQYVWGNTLITPLGYLLTASYGLDGSIVLYRSSDVFSISDTSDIAMVQVAQLDTGGAAEPTIAYYKDVLFIIWRKSVGTVGKYATTYNTEGLGGWGTSINAPREVHAPYADPYNIGKDELLVMFSLGNARSILATMASQNLTTWHTTATVLCAGNTTLASGQSGGYPSFVDYGENISVQSYADFRHSDMTRTSRLDVRMLKKQTFSAKNNIAACLEEYFNSALEWGEYSLGTSAATVDISVVFKRELSINYVALRMSGVSNNTFVELVNSAGVVVATSSKPTISAPLVTNIVFTFPRAVAASATPYTVRIQRRDTVNPHVFNWTNNKLRTPRVINNKTYNITNLTSASSSTLWTDVGIHVSLY